MSSQNSVSEICTTTNLAPIYGLEKAKVVIKFAYEDFAPYAENFPPMRAQIQRGHSQGLLLTMQQVQKSGVKAWIGIFFPPAFPTQPPQAALLLSPSQYIDAGHRIVAPNGAVRMKLLDCGEYPDSLMNIVLSLTIVLDDSPVKEKGGQGLIAQTGPTHATTHSSQEPTNVPLTPQQQQLHELFLQDIFQINDKYLSVRMEAVAHEDTLKAAAEGLEREAEGLRQTIDLLQIAEQDQIQLEAAISAYTTQNPNATPLDRLAATDCIEPENELHSQALELLATVSAYEDQLDFLERCLARGALTSDQYLRYVNNIAREEFSCRFLFQRAVDKVQQATNMQILIRRFAGKGLDEQVIGSVLAANAYNIGKAERALFDIAA